MIANDVLKRAEPFMAQCGPCDYGLPMGCACPVEDFRPIVADLVTEVKRLRSVVAAAYGFADDMAVFCSPYGVSADYAEKLRNALNRADMGERWAAV